MVATALQQIRAIGNDPRSTQGWAICGKAGNGCPLVVGPAEH